MENQLPTECEYEGCTEPPIVGVNDHYGCEKHLQWLFDEFAVTKRKLLDQLLGEDDGG